MRLSSKRHGEVNVHYYQDSVLFHTYKLNGRTIANKLKWMFRHILERRADLNKGDLKLVVYDDGGVRMINRTTGARSYTVKGGRNYLWHEEVTPNIATMHEDYAYNE
jgi:hypothetical protein